MYVKICYFWLVIIVQSKLAYSTATSISGEVLEDVTFIYNTFPGPPSRKVTIEYSVSFYFSRHVDYFILGIYTTPDHVNIQKNCTNRFYGQVRNTAMHQYFGYEHNYCDPGENSTHHCTGNITVQDFIPRNFSFSFGFACYDIKYPTALSLKGLVFNITIYRLADSVTCLPLTGDSICYQYYKHGALPNLLGEENLRDTSLSYLVGNNFQCYQHALELLFHVYIPECRLGFPKQSIRPCREMCQDYFHACGNDVINMDCDYLPSLNDDIQCYDKIVICDYPVTTTNVVGFMIPTTKRTLAMIYKCNEGFRLEGNSTSTCLYTGEWSSEPPICWAETPATPIKPWVLVLIAIFTLYIAAMVIIIIAVIHKMRLKAAKKIRLQRERVEIGIDLKEIDAPLMFYRKKKDPVKTGSPVKRNREFHSFVLYHFDSDDDFVVETLLPELEETRDFRLCMHSRDFTQGRDIKDNIEEAIEGSNSANIIMSKGFVDSIWCREEFTQCYIENMKDAAFNLFVIMMQPADTLVNISPYMKTFIANKTYLQMKDPELFSKLAKHLENVKQLDNDDIDDDNHENLGNENDQIEDFKLYWHLDEIATQEIKV